MADNTDTVSQIFAYLERFRATLSVLAAKGNEVAQVNLAAMLKNFPQVGDQESAKSS